MINSENKNNSTGMDEEARQAIKAAMASPHAQAKILSEALPHLQRYDDKIVVVKYGGHAMGDPDLARFFARDIVLLKQAGVHPVVVHGGGPQIGAMLERLKIKSEFAHGLRITDAATVEIVEMVLAGSINKQIVANINNVGGSAVGISGKDGKLMVARKLRKEVVDPDSNLMKVLDLGFVGEPYHVNTHIIDVIIKSDIIPVIAPIGVSDEGETFNINADTFAGALASALRAKRLLLLTDVAGVLNKDGKLIEKMTRQEARGFIADGTIHGGMIPKIESCLKVVDAGVEAVVIINGKVPHAVLLELFTKHGAGTLLREREEAV
jgi:acetylglutamate kinase